MSETALRGPEPSLRSVEHPVADLANAVRLAAAIPEKKGALARLQNRHFLSTRDLDPETLLQVLRLAAHYESQGRPDACPLNGRILSSVFVGGALSETRLSFASAWLRLGGSILDFEESPTRPGGGRYSPDELAELCSNYGDIVVLRTAASDSLETMVDHFRVPVINAGNGDDEHPTNAMADLYTLLKWRPDLLAPAPERPINIAISGDPARTRTIRSFLLLLSKFPQMVGKVVIMDRLAATLPPGSTGGPGAGWAQARTGQRILPQGDHPRRFQACPAGDGSGLCPPLWWPPGPRAWISSPGCPPCARRP